MKTKRFLALALAVMLTLTLFAGCAGTESSKPESEPAATSSEPAETSSEPAAEPVGADVNIAVLKGPTGMGAAYLMEQNSLGETVNNYTFTVAGAPDEITAGLVSGELDMAALPTNAIAALYKKTNGGVQALAVNTLGVLYILENGETVKSAADLAGKTILASGKGSTAEYVLTYILKENGLTDGENVTIEWAAEHAEAATKAAAGDYSIVMLPEPFVTSLQKQAPDFRVALDLTAEWENAAGSTLAMGGVAVRKEFADANPEAVAAFLTEYAESAAYVNENVAEAAALCEKYDIIAAAVAEAAIPRANIVCLTGDDMRNALSDFYSVLLTFAPDSIGGALPESDFYYYAK